MTGDHVCGGEADEGAFVLWSEGYGDVMVGVFLFVKFGGLKKWSHYIPDYEKYCFPFLSFRTSLKYL